MSKEKVDYIRRGRELRRFLLEHGTEENDLGFTPIDLAWMEKYSPPQESEEGEGMFPDKWVDASGCVTQSFTSTRAHWRKAMTKLDGQHGTVVQGSVEAVVDGHAPETNAEPPVQSQSPPKSSSFQAGMSTVRWAASRLGEFVQGDSRHEDLGQQEQGQSHSMAQQPDRVDGEGNVSAENAYRRGYATAPIVSPQPERTVQTPWTRPISGGQTLTGAAGPPAEEHHRHQGHYGDVHNPQQGDVSRVSECAITSNYPDNSQDWAPRYHADADEYYYEGSYQTPAPSQHSVPASFPDENICESREGHQAQEGYHPFDEWRTAAYANPALSDTRARSRQDFVQSHPQSQRGESLPLRPRITPGCNPQDNRSSFQPPPQPFSAQPFRVPNTEPRPMRFGDIPLVQWYVENRRGRLPSVTAPTCQTTGASHLYASVKAEIERRGLDVPAGDKASLSTKVKGKGRAAANPEDNEIEGETGAGKSSHGQAHSHRRTRT
ncbi:hypothetical protein CEP54_014438 [Fusarium duplospermum]|uniref:Uncharacterized protein n=1 Tax=Fusarium duplospermum TaxID=1325734 RepID=A0A428NWF2_9HYPO|nr:hypothetical protein CEP54_014438 [Fusarium duplospermum]